MADRHVTISGSGTQLSVDPSDAPISKSAAEQVLWRSDIQGKTCTITFSDSPFNSSTFSVGSTGTTVWASEEQCVSGRHKLQILSLLPGIYDSRSQCDRQ